MIASMTLRLSPTRPVPPTHDPSADLQADALLPWRDRVALTWRSLQQWPWLDTLRTLRQRFREDHLGLTASSLTFTTMIALVPLAAVMFAVFTAFPIFGTFRKALEVYFIQNLVPDAIAKPVLGALTQFALKANRLGSVGLVALVFTALTLMLTIDRTLNAIWRVRKPRSIAQRVLVYWAAATLGPLVLGVSLSLTSYALSASKGFVGAMPGGVSLLLNTLELVLMAAAMAGLFRYVPNTHVRWVHAWAGGWFVSLGLEAAKSGLAWYLSAVPTYSTIYGAFAAVPIFFIWLYVGWVIVLLGAVIAAYAPSLKMRVARHPDTPGHRFSLALDVLRELARARRDRRGLSLLALAAGLHIDPLQIEPVVEVLIQLDWVGRLEEAGTQRLVLLIDPHATLLAPLLGALLLQPSAATAPFWTRAQFTEIQLGDALGL
jgi:membrane protein